ncbi:hypothetical protein MIND_00810800 [Mycena indigotica]|uniref:Cytochrome P450 n=1 Tax=Mycena indigotica TaxID=2126181 RepID=A0A8H6VYM9_9AGAR|nr:uncharacterized protein MIND_00810800 [Mycena indigotica]KAF7298637.1 hypothetical protein MIND_00810800 [Mycena indigotica]
MSLQIRSRGGEAADMHKVLLGAQVVAGCAAALAIYVAINAVIILYTNLSSPLHAILPAPPIHSIILGNSKQIEDMALMAKWCKDFGNNFLMHGLFGVCSALTFPDNWTLIGGREISRLHTADLKALNHIMAKTEIYHRPVAFQQIIRGVMGEGLLFAESEQHKRQRRVINPAFGIPQIRDMTEMIVGKAIQASMVYDLQFLPHLFLQLRDIWIDQVGSQAGDGDKLARSKGTTIDVFSGIREMALDVIGITGFGHEFNALQPPGVRQAAHKHDDLHHTITELFHSPSAGLYRKLKLVQIQMPLLRFLPLPGGYITNLARTRLAKTGAKIVQNHKASLLETEADPAASQGKRDLLSLLMKANISAELPDSQRLSGSEVISQIATLFIAGNGSISSATTWALHALSLNKQMQSTLREELLTISTDNPTFDEVNGLPFLEKVVRETLRLYAPVPSTARQAIMDDVLPLAQPVVDREGRTHWSLPIRKGQMVHIPIGGVNTSTETWGEDALEFKPDRWDNIPAAAREVPSIWGNIFTFLAKTHNCVGFRLALLELKIILFTLIRAFEIGPVVPESAIGRRFGGITQRPVVVAGQHRGSGLPLVLTPVQNVA